MRRQLGQGTFSVLIAALLAACGGGGGGGGGSSSSLSFPFEDYLQVSSASPDPNSVEIETDVNPSVTFDRAVDVSTLSGNFRLETSGSAVSGSISVSSDHRTVSFVPDARLEGETVYQIRITPSVKSAAGVPLYIESLTPFQTLPDFNAKLFPYNGAIFVPLNNSFAVLFSRPVDPATVNSSTLRVEKNSVAVAGTISLELGDRVAVFEPSAALSASSIYTFSVEGGPGGILSEDGAELAASSQATVSTTSGSDVTVPTARATVLEIPSTMNSNLYLPLSGTRIDLIFFDGSFGFVNPGSCRLTANVAIGSIAAGTNLLTALPIVAADYGKFRVHIPSSLPLAEGTVIFTAEVSDLAGNAAVPGTLACSVVTPNNDLKPFEHTQICWSRFDMDRDEESGSDFTKDLLVYGLIAEGDPLGKNASLQDQIEAGIVDWANALFQSNSWGRVVVSRNEPGSALYMKIAVGGLDPGASSGSLTGSTTGVLGRAYFDDLNSSFTEDDTATSPPLGVFPREMFRAYTTAYVDLLFSSTFSPLAPSLGGTPVGAHAEDAAVLSSSFNYATATTAQQNRYNTVQTALTRFKKVVGFLLAHETAHSCGLVPDALNGQLYHNKNGSASDVMLPSVSFSSIAQLDVKFRALDLTYLLQMLMKV